MATEKRLIDANALIESGYEVTLDKVFPDWAELPGATKEAVCKHGQYLKKMINELPTVDAVEVVHGRWFMRGGRFRCSECDAVALLKLDINVGGCREYGHFRSSYCPNCGAKMDGDGNG